MAGAGAAASLVDEARAAGTSASSLLPRCSQEHRPALAPTVDGRSPLVVALSGGGFRATLTALGVVRYLAAAGLLGDVRAVSSVSGGGITNGLLARHHADLHDDGFTLSSFDRLVTAPIVGAVSGSSLSGELIRNLWRAAGRRTRTDLLATSIDRRWLHGAQLEAVSPRCRFIFSAANLTTGARYIFTNEAVGDYVIGHAPVGGTGLTIAGAVAASAAVPGAFASHTPAGVRYPCGAAHPAPKLIDGGAYDNLGLDAIDDHPEATIVACNAGGVYLPGALRGIPIVRDLQRANSSLYKQSTAVRSRMLVERFEADRAWITQPEPRPPRPSWARRGVLFGLGSSIGRGGGGAWIEPADPAWRDLISVPTSFARFEPALCERLVRRGWWLTGASLDRWHPELVPSPPRWTAIPLEA